MNIEQFEKAGFKESPFMEYISESTVVTNKFNKVTIFKDLDNYTIRKYVANKCTFETVIPLDDNWQLKKELKKITKR